MRITNSKHPKGHDAGPNRQHGNPTSILLSMARPLPEGVTWRDTPSAWLKPKPRPEETPTERTAYDPKAYNREHRAANLEHYRALERERDRRRRERRKAAA